MANSVDSKKLFSYVFIFVLALLFAVQWGPGSKGCTALNDVKETADVAATVNGKEIPLRDFSRAYAGQLANYRSQALRTGRIQQWRKSRRGKWSRPGGRGSPSSVRR